MTVVSKTQTATSDNAVFDRATNKVLLTGNATLSDGANVTQGDRVVYDLDKGVANIENPKGGRVRAMFVPGGAPEAAGKPDAPKAEAPKTEAAPKPKAKPQPRPTAAAQ